MDYQLVELNRVLNEALKYIDKNIPPNPNSEECLQKYWVQFINGWINILPKVPDMEPYKRNAVLAAISLTLVELYQHKQ